MTRDIFLRSRINESEKSMLDQIQEKRGLANQSETVRYLIHMEYRDIQGENDEKTANDAGVANRG